ncbi:MAG TPA: aspartate aminotransferase family protein [Geobacterales bacterium]|nr:aspartate aminotransferase family protein [Geobacterales bacterium]
MLNYREIEDLHQLNSFYKLPVVIERGEGFYVYDIEGKKYLDFMCGYGVALLGHNHEVIKNAIIEQINKIITCHSSLYLDVRAEFLELLFSVLPSELSRCFLTNSGSEAIELAIKLVRKKGKKKIISMENSYHGKTFGALSLTGKKKYRESFEPLLQYVEFAKYNNIEDLMEKIDEETGAIIVEPIQGESGVIIPDEEYLRTIRDICDEKGIILVLDEIQTGLGRTGRLFCFEYSKVIPDILCIGKGLAGGLPVGCVITREEFNLLKTGEHTSTFSANPLVCAVAKNVLKFIVDNQLWENAKIMGEEFLKGLRNLDNKGIKEIRGKGLMVAIEFKIDVKNTLNRLMKNGLICCYTAPNTLRFLPPLNIRIEQIKEAIEKIANGTY